MTPATIGVIGYGPTGKRVADAILLQPDFRLAGVFETDPQRAKVIRARGIPLVDGDLIPWSAGCHVVVVCQEQVPELPTSAIYGPEIGNHVPLYSGTTPPPGTNRLRVPCADALALSRLLANLPLVERVFCNSARRSGLATDSRNVLIDALEPLFVCPSEDADVRELLAPQIRDICIRRTRLPYTHSHLHHLKLDLAAPMTLDAVRHALLWSHRVRVAPGAVSFPDTSRLQEYERDLESPRGDRLDVFVWEESIDVVGTTVYLTADVSPDAAPVLEIIDAVRSLARPDLSMWNVARLTDQSMAKRR
jgi:glyceraldehyde-3-phosphate dehydrogenase (NAD(P))